MELKNKISMNKIPFILLLICLFASCSKDADGENNGTIYKYSGAIFLIIVSTFSLKVFENETDTSLSSK